MSFIGLGGAGNPDNNTIKLVGGQLVVQATNPITNTSGIGITSNSASITYGNNFALPANVLNYVSVKLVNTTTVAVAAGTPLRITVNSNTFSSYLAANLKNVNWFDVSGNVLKSWLESGETNTSTSTVYWVQAPTGGIAGNNGVAYVYMGMAATGTALIDGVNVGAEPSWAGGTYGQYDNGSSVFSSYYNYKGTTLPSGLSSAGGAQIAINNGVTLTGNGTSVYIGETTATNPQTYIVEAYSKVTVGTSPQPLNYADGYNNSGTNRTEVIAGTNWQLQNVNGSGNSAIAIVASDTSYHVFSLWGTASASYAQVDYAHQTSYTTDYTASTSQVTTLAGTYTLNDVIISSWARRRLQLNPTDTMPTVTVGSLNVAASTQVTLATTFTNIASVTFTPTISGTILIQAFGVMSSLTDATQLQVYNNTTSAIVKTVANADKIVTSVSGLTLNTAYSFELKGQSASGTDTYTPQYFVVQEVI